MEVRQGAPTTTTMLEHVPCNLCGADHYKIMYKRPSSLAEEAAGQGYAITQNKPSPPGHIVKCLRCGLTYVNPRQTPQELLDKYTSMVDKRYLEEEAGRRKTARSILKKLRRFKRKDAKLLEIGSATGFLLDEAQKDGWVVHGLEVSQWAADYTSNTFGITVSRNGLSEAGFAPGTFDAVVLSDTLEHLLDPKQLLLEVRPLLSPQGVVYINTPNIDSVASRIFKARWWGLNQFHLYYFTKRTLQELLQATGFEALRWGCYARTFSMAYWLDKVQGYSSVLRALVGAMARLGWAKEALVTVNAGDQIEVIAERKRKMEYLPEIERADRPGTQKDMKVTVVLPAYNAGRTLRQTVKDIPRDLVNEILLVDDASTDDTVAVARELGLEVFRHDKNKGYGANQKTCYTKALERGADIIVMIHPDYQYDPKAIPAMITPIRQGAADAVFGSRMLKGGALEGGMPLWKHNCNIIFTALANVMLGTYLTEYHSGFRAYSARSLRAIPFMDNSNNFVFDTEIIIQLLLHYFKIDEVPIRTRYFEEASVITRWAGFWYGVRILKTLLKYGLHKRGIVKFAQFE